MPAHQAMAKQLYLLNVVPPPLRLDRLFFGVFPDNATAGCVAHLASALRNQHGLRGKPLAAKRFHVSLYHLGDYARLPQDIVALAKQAGSTIAMPPFEIAFDHAMSFSGRYVYPENSHTHPFVLLGGDGVAAMTVLRQMLDAAMRTVSPGRRIGKALYTPHMTMLYDQHSVAEHPVEPIRWTAREFVLVHSLVGETRYLPLARWPLRGRPPKRAADPSATAHATG